MTGDYTRGDGGFGMDGTTSTESRPVSMRVGIPRDGGLGMGGTRRSSESRPVSVRGDIRGVEFGKMGDTTSEETAVVVSVTYGVV